MLSELAPVMTTILSLIPSMKFCFRVYHSKAPSLIANRARFIERVRGEVVVQFVPLPKFGSSVTCFPFS